MTSIRPVSRMHFENELTAEILRVSRTIQLALMVGPLFFAFCVLMIYVQRRGEPASSGGLEALGMLTVIHLLLTMVAPIAAIVLANRAFSPERLVGDVNTSQEELGKQCVMLQRTGMILRMAVLEGTAFFGLVLCMTGAVSGILEAEPIYWVNLASAGLVIFFGVTTFPSKERLLDWFDKRIHGTSQ